MIKYFLFLFVIGFTFQSWVVEAGGEFPRIFPKVGKKYQALIPLLSRYPDGSKITPPVLSSECQLGLGGTPIDPTLAEEPISKEQQWRVLSDLQKLFSVLVDAINLDEKQRKESKGNATGRMKNWAISKEYKKLKLYMDDVFKDQVIAVTLNEMVRLPGMDPRLKRFLLFSEVPWKSKKEKLVKGNEAGGEENPNQPLSLVTKESALDPVYEIEEVFAKGHPQYKLEKDWRWVDGKEGKRRKQVIHHIRVKFKGHHELGWAIVEDMVDMHELGKLDQVL